MPRAENPERHRRRSIHPMLKAFAATAVVCAVSSRLIAANAVALPCRGFECSASVSNSSLFPRQARHIITSGPTGGTRSRLEINDLVKDDEQWSLFVQALAAMQKDDQGTLTSFFQISGIHGQPYVRYDGSGGTRPPQDAWGGYCNHGSVLFPTWHRPYVALFEQQLQAKAAQIAKGYGSQAERFQAAARDLRLPFWDWASNSVPPNQVISDTQVAYTAIDGSKKKMANPLFSYQFHPVDKSFNKPYNSYVATLRHPTGSGANAKTDVDALRKQLASVQNDFRSKTYNMLTRVHTWNAFSNHDTDDGSSTSNSLEAIHDGIHVDVGGGNGDMTDPAVAAFDPIFWLHHANVDRLISLWEAMNPDVWVDKGPSGAGSWTIHPNTQVDANTDLTPFWNSQSTYWRSSQITTTEKFGYQYPDFDGLQSKDSETVRKAITKRINQLYGPSRASRRAFTGDNDEHNATAYPVPSEWPSFDWTIRVQCELGALNRSYAVLVFVGPVPEDASQYRYTPSFVGAHSVWTNPEMAGSYTTQGFVHLNNALSQAGIGSFDPEFVKPFLKKHLNWRIVKADGEDTPIEAVPSLKILTVATRMTLSPGAALPDYGEPQPMPDITVGRPGSEPSSE